MSHWLNIQLKYWQSRLGNLISSQNTEGGGGYQLSKGFQISNCYIQHSSTEIMRLRGDDSAVAWTLTWGFDNFLWTVLHSPGDSRLSPGLLTDGLQPQVSQSKYINIRNWTSPLSAFDVSQSRVHTINSPDIDVSLSTFEIVLTLK